MTPFSLDRLLVYRDPEPRSAAMNMAVDEALLELTEQPALRFYTWARPALSFGYFGKFSEAAGLANDRDLVRRWTGGGIVLHGVDLTYSFVLPAAHGGSVRSAHGVYARLHGAMREVLQRSNVPAVLAESPAPKVSEACFANPVADDLLLGGRKIAGAAQRRTRAGLLQQGSVQDVALPADFAERFARAVCKSSEKCSLPDAVIQRAREIAAEKYGTESWLRSR